MKRDLPIVFGCIVATGLTIWSYWGNSPKNGAPRQAAMQQLDIDPDLKTISERSPYMRSER